SAEGVLSLTPARLKQFKSYLLRKREKR
uniref:Uncharacterized protein n=1 Tax=Solanum lycopersicum TaxID=4081 RepID=A0A3Q7FP02_SOLLC